MKAAVVTTWTQPLPGREKKALECAAEANAFWSRQAQEGKCTEPEIFISDTGVGIWMVEGDRDVLTALSQTSVRSVIRAADRR